MFPEVESAAEGSRATDSAHRRGFVIRTDGAARGNPGPASAGVALYDLSRPDARHPRAAPDASISEYLGVQTNNVAEYYGLIGALDYAQQRLCDQLAVCCQTRHLTHQQQRRVTQLHLLAGLHGQRRDFFSGDLGHQLADASGDCDTILIKLALPQHAGQHRPAQLLLGSDVLRRRAFVRLLGLHPGKSA